MEETRKSNGSFWIILILACAAIGIIVYYMTNSSAKPKQDPPVVSIDEKKFKDSFKEATLKEVNRSIANNQLSDTLRLQDAPIKVLSARLFREEYSSYRSIELTFKNVSQKSIEGIKFQWYGLNAFGEPADMGNSFLEGFGGGFTDRTIEPGVRQTLHWSILSRDGKKVVRAWPTEVAFSDGTKWKLNE
jgi:hypothetical protein